MSEQQSALPPEDLLKIWVKCTSELLTRARKRAPRERLWPQWRRCRKPSASSCREPYRRYLRWAEGNGWATHRAEQQVASWPCDHAGVLWHSFQFWVSYVISWVPEQCSFVLVYQMQTRLSLLTIQKRVPWSRHRDWYHAFFLITVSFHPTNE